MTDLFDSPIIRGSKKSSHTNLLHQLFGSSPKNDSRNLLADEELAANQTTIPRTADRTPEQTSKSEFVTRCTGRVSDLRRYFERSTARDSSPNSFKSFWQSRSRSKQVPEVGEITPTRYGPAESPAALATDITPIERIPVPELTTEILTNDFSCNFIETASDSGSMTPKAHFESQAEEATPTKQESPVKARIQQFESLGCGSPTASQAQCCRAKSYDANLNSPLRGKENDPKQVKTRAGWRPFRQRSLELWRRISNSFRPAAVGDGGTHHGEEDDSRSHIDTDVTRPPSVRRRLRYCRSDIFGYQLYRTSRVVRSPSSSSCSGSSIHTNDEIATRVDSQSPYLTCRRSPSDYLPMRRAFPFLARMSDELGCSDEFDNFGFDGSIVSKTVRRRTKSPSTQEPQRRYQSSSSPTPHGDLNTLSDVVSQQTAAERKRRRLEEKQLRQKERDLKREEKTKSKGKEKETSDSYNETDGERAGYAQDKGKGKEAEGKKKEKSWSTKTASGFVVRQISDIKLKHPIPRRPGQVKKIVNMYKEKSNSGIKLGKGNGVGSGSGGAGASAGAVNK
ncbi:hypothetical protein F5Y05DRAFT_115805 [Hypoxylon sp. FL0543]|nr:hypothetical protein F5Y05DRAFT_115805 [Hypoxylon sp. FL0543]